VKILVPSLMLFLSLSSYAAPVDLACIVAKMNISEDGNDITSSAILFEQTLTINENDSALILIEENTARLIGGNDLQLTDDGKMLYALSQNIDPDGEDEAGLNVVTGKLDFSTPNSFVQKNLTQVGSLKNINFTLMDFENKIALKCAN
jgi:hypothetical protein